MRPFSVRRIKSILKAQLLAHWVVRYCKETRKPSGCISLLNSLTHRNVSLLRTLLFIYYLFSYVLSQRCNPLHNHTKCIDLTLPAARADV